MSVDPTAPAAPAEDSHNTVAPGASDPAPAPVTPAAPAAAEVLAERNRRAAEGRKAAALERTVAQLTQTVNTLGLQISASEQRRLNEELAQLDPLERADRRIEMLERRIAGAPPQPTLSTSRPPQVQPDVEYTQNRSQEILDQINAELGTDLKVDDPGLNWEDEAPFQASAYRLAAQKVRALGTVQPPKVEAKEDDVPKAAATEEEITARVTDTIRRELGISSPAGPQPNSPRASAGAPTEADFQKTVEGYNSKLGPRATLAKLREQREAAAKAAGL